MAVLIPAVGKAAALAALLNKVAPEDLVLKLYTSNTTPDSGDTAANYTEASGSGYASVPLAGGDWTVSAGSPTYATFAQQTFTFSGALGNVYGYYLVQSATGTLMWAERFSDGPYEIVNSGDQIKITPRIEFQ
jgi:hypothetical protein